MVGEELRRPLFVSPFSLGSTNTTHPSLLNYISFTLFAQEKGVGWVV